jgi:tetratricopeptide (TPR) repeat protein
VRNNDLVSPLTANSVIEWANSCPAATCDPDPGLALHDRTPFARPVRPDSTHYRSKTRWNKAMGASDSYCDNEFTTDLRARLTLGDYEAIPEALALAPDPNDRGFIYEAAADWEKRPAFLDQWERDEPDSPVRLTVEGIYWVKAAWLARGSGWNAKDVGGFFAHLESSMASLQRAVEIDPNESAAWAWRIYTAKGLQWSPDDVRALYDRAASIAPGYRQPASMHLDYLAPKWHGDTDSYLRFAREATARAPRGSTLPVLIAEAHIEMATGWGRPGATDKGPAHWSKPGVAEEVLAANRQCFTGHTECMDSARTRVFFAYALWKCGRTTEAAEHLRIIGKSTPWGPFQAPIPILAKDTIKKARRACGV